MPSRPYYVDVPLRWSDMDALRHVNNVQIVRLLEEARIIALREWFAGGSSDAATGRRPDLLIARQEIDYVSQLHYRAEPVVIAIWVSKISGASFDVCYEVQASRADDAEVYAAAESTLVAFDLESQRPQRISADNRQVLERVSGPPVALKRRPVGHQ